MKGIPTSENYPRLHLMYLYKANASFSIDSFMNDCKAIPVTWKLSSDGVHRITTSLFNYYQGGNKTSLLKSIGMPLKAKESWILETDIPFQK